MRIELIDNEAPLSFWVFRNQLSNVVGKIGFLASRGKIRNAHLSFRDIPTGNQTQRPMPNVFKFLQLDLSERHRFGGINPFECLDARHFIATHQVGATGFQSGCLQVQLAHGINLLLKLTAIFQLSVEPVAVAMGLERGFLLKNVPRYGEKSMQQCHV